MSLAVIITQRETDFFVSELKKHLPGENIEVWPNISNPADVEFVVVWKHPEGELGKYPRLQAVSSYGAGVDQILADKNLSNDVQVCRVVDVGLVSEMTEFVLASVLYHFRGLGNYQQAQQSKVWHPVAKKKASDTVVTVLGLGQLGKASAVELARQGFEVRGWSRSKTTVEGVKTFSESQMEEAVSGADVVVCLLPLTPSTRGILSAKLFDSLAPGACLINAARGEHLNEEDLVQVIHKKQIFRAILDVFSQEPLPVDHIFWDMPEVLITPHIASVSAPEAVALQISENYMNLKNGRPLKNRVARELGY